MKTLEEAIQEAYEKGFIDNPDDPWADLDCFGKGDPELQGYPPENNCEECPLESFCLEAYEEGVTGVMVP